MTLPRYIPGRRPLRCLATAAPAARRRTAAGPAQGQTTSGPGRAHSNFQAASPSGRPRHRHWPGNSSSESERPGPPGRAAAGVRTLNHRDLRVRLITGTITDLFSLPEFKIRVNSDGPTVPGQTIVLVTCT